MKKNDKKIISLALAVLMLFSLLTSCADTRSQDIVVLFTNDVHCGIEENIGYAGLAAYKKEMESEHKYVTLVDCGDAIQGDFIGTVSDGGYIVDIMNELDYELAAIGNHEFDYGMERLSDLIDKAEAEYLACNITYTGNGKNLLADVKPYEIIEYGRKEIAFIGVSTPESIAKSTPSYFMENGEFVYGFTSGNQGEALYACVQNYIDECRKNGADYVVILSHLGDVAESSPYTSIDLIENTTGVDALLDGHAHSVIASKTVKNESGEDVILSSTGTKFANVGKLVITKDGKISTELISEYTEKDPQMTAYLEAIKKNYEKEMNAVIATSDITLSCTTESGVRLVRNRETAIGNFVADAYRTIGNADIGVVNGGGIRADIPAGEITYADMLAVHPFGNTLCVVKATGAEILDLLETACRYTQAQYEADGNAVGENGGFQQVSGLKFTIDTSIESGVVLDENGTMVSISGKRRVKDVYVLNQNNEYVPIDENAVYTIASHNYLLRDGGDSYAGFTDNEFIIEEGIADYQILTTYMTEYLNGDLGRRYSETEGRITIQ